MPPPESHYRTLCPVCRSKKKYHFCKLLLIEKEMRTIRDFLVWYTNCPVNPFLYAIESPFDLSRSDDSTS